MPLSYRLNIVAELGLGLGEAADTELRIPDKITRPTTTASTEWIIPLVLGLEPLDQNEDSEQLYSRWTFGCADVQILNPEGIFESLGEAGLLNR